MKRLLFIILCIGLTAHAQVRVVKSANRKIGIQLSGMQVSGAAAQTFFQTLENDLRIFGWFSPSRSSGELMLSGSASVSGGKLKVIAQVFQKTDQTRLFSKRYSIDSSQARTLAHRLADDLVESIVGKKGIASTKIAVIGTRSGAKELYLCDADGGSLRQLTRDRSIIVGANWGPEGETLVYTSFMRQFPDIYRVNLRTGKRDVLASYGGLNTGAALSPDGKELALILSKDGNPELYVQNLRSGALRRMTQTLRATEASPSWSPDGRHLVYVSDQSGSPQLYVMARNGGRPRRISSRGSENVAPDWGPDGRIACASRSGRQYHIAVIDPASGSAQYLPAGAGDFEDPSWAPDGRHIIATRTVNYQSDLYLLDTVSDPPVALLKGLGNWISPAWSPR
jgi:TolB protein